MIPRLAEKGKRLTYAVDAPLPYINRGSLPDVVVTVRGVTVSNLTIQKVGIWNSGDVPLVDLPIRFELVARQPVRVLSVSHATIPPLEFGVISENGSDT